MMEGEEKGMVGLKDEDVGCVEDFGVDRDGRLWGCSVQSFGFRALGLRDRDSCKHRAR